MFLLETLSQTFTSYTALRRHYTCGFLFAYRGYDNASYRFGPQIQKQEEKLFQYARGLSVLWGHLSLTPCSPHLLLLFTSKYSVRLYLHGFWLLPALDLFIDEYPATAGSHHEEDEPKMKQQQA